MSDMYTFQVITKADGLRVFRRNDGAETPALAIVVADDVPDGTTFTAPVACVAAGEVFAEKCGQAMLENNPDLVQALGEDLLRPRAEKLAAPPERSGVSFLDNFEI